MTDLQLGSLGIALAAVFSTGVLITFGFGPWLMSWGAMGLFVWYKAMEERRP